MVDLQEKKENRKIKKSQTCIIFICILQKTVGRARRSRNQVGLA